MKRLGKIAMCLAGGLALNAGLRAASPPATNHLAPANHPPSTNRPALAKIPIPANNPLPIPANNVPSDTPYATIAARNIFGLNPPPPPAPPEDPGKNLPKITPSGIFGVFGHYQVLFKVTPPAGGKAGPAAKEASYILSEGQRQDDIEVVKIDDKKSLVTFDNNGFTQELPLASATSSGGTAPSSSGGMNPGGALGNPARFGSNAGGGGFTSFGGGRGGPNGGGPIGNSPLNGGSPNGPNGPNGLGGGMDFNASIQGRTYQPEASTLKQDESVILIEAQRAVLMNDPHPAYSPNLLPPTELTKFNTPDGSVLPGP